MPTVAKKTASSPAHSMHGVGVVCGLAAGAWLGGAEVPAKLASTTISPIAISLCMVAGVFVEQWTIPSLLKGSKYVFADVRENRHLIVWGILAGALWAIANTLTVFAIRDVGLAIAFPLWNTNCLVGIFWGWLLFNELRGASIRNWLKVLGGTLAILIAALMLAYSSMHGSLIAPAHARQGILAALCASLMWGTMYVPYRKAYLSGMNPLSFVTVFTVGELVTMLLLAVSLRGGIHPLVTELRRAHSAVFWLFLGGFCWVIGDLFQHYSTKYIGIGRAIPLSNTNQLWGLIWGALVFGELASTDTSHHVIVVAGSLLMLLGALGISTSAASSAEHASTDRAITRECDRYSLDHTRVFQAQTGTDTKDTPGIRRGWWDYAIILTACCIFVVLARGASRPTVPMNMAWADGLLAILLLTFLGGGYWLWKKTRFS
ncbi:MAG TPA: GRP family sugar transporter [Acidobacteriaceae bacterium]|nr:GRP family sugar transporter [Terriglobia bacterium]HVC89952.1 GRP family sugar transporter [Acidobacteriaceae bacterium]